MIENHVNQRVDLSTFQRSKVEGQCNGDSFFVTETENYFVCIVADGLGSGQAAHDASTKAVKVVEQCHEKDIHTLMKMCNDELLNTRGAVITIFKFHFKKRTLEYCSIGNIRLILGAPTGKLIHPLPKSGFLCGKPMQFRVSEMDYQEGSMFIIYSDGIDLSSADKRNVLRTRNPKIASNFIRQKSLSTIDDMTCLIGKVI